MTEYNTACDSGGGTRLDLVFRLKTVVVLLMFICTLATIHIIFRIRQAKAEVE